MWNIFIIHLTRQNLKSGGLHFEKFFTINFFLGGWTSGFHAIDD